MKKDQEIQINSQKEHGLTFQMGQLIGAIFLLVLDSPFIYFSYLAAKKLMS